MARHPKTRHLGAVFKAPTQKLPQFVPLLGKPLQPTKTCCFISLAVPTDLVIGREGTEAVLFEFQLLHRDWKHHKLGVSIHIVV